MSRPHPETSLEQLDRNRVEDESLAQKQAELGRPLPDLEKLIPIAQRVLTDPAGLWKEARGNARLALQSFLFPEGVTPSTARRWNRRNQPCVQPLARVGEREGRDGEGKVTRLERFAAGVLELEAYVRKLIRAA